MKAHSPPCAPAARRLTKFNGVHSLDLHIPANFGASHTRIHFIGLKGEFTEVHLALRLCASQHVWLECGSSPRSRRRGACSSWLHAGTQHENKPATGS